jgi:GTPase
VSYVVKEHLERLMWWMALPGLLDVAAEPNVDTERLAAIFNEIDLILRAVQEGGYRVESLEQAARLEGKGLERENSL